MLDIVNQSNDMYGMCSINMLLFTPMQFIERKMAGNDLGRKRFVINLHQDDDVSGFFRFLFDEVNRCSRN